jgi:putative methyltransferase (TIGR04325 family)
MLPRLKQLVKQLLPPIVFNATKALTNRDKKYGFFGNYKSWEDACRDCTGYDSELILGKVRDALLKVKNGEALYERDSVLFDKIHYSFPLLAGLQRVAAKNEGKLNVLDFGGSLGSSYFQCKHFLSDLKDLNWNIVEQEQFVNVGKKYFEDNCLKFYLDIDSCLKDEQPNVIVLSSVIQYLENPYAFIEDIILREFKHIVLDITSLFENSSSDRLTVQRVSPEIYDASYPAWIFNKQNFLSCFSQKYELIAEFDSLYSEDLQVLSAKLQGFIFERIT